MMMRTKSRKILTAAAAVAIAAAAVGGLVKWSTFATTAAAVEKGGLGVSPFEIMLKSDHKKLPLEPFRDGECPDRC